jgi:hypothetical protein
VTTTADFYDGRGPSAVWLGSLQGDADPETVRAVACGRLVLDATDPFTFADAVIDLLAVWVDEDLGHGYHPREGWPWLWPDSRDTDWVFAFVHGRVWITTGRAWLPAGPPVAGYNGNETGEGTR